jgi:hypothetical protein
MKRSAEEEAIDSFEAKRNRGGMKEGELGTLLLPEILEQVWRHLKFSPEFHSLLNFSRPANSVKRIYSFPDFPNENSAPRALEKDTSSLPNGEGILFEIVSVAAKSPKISSLPVLQWAVPEGARALEGQSTMLLRRETWRLSSGW